MTSPQPGVFSFNSGGLSSGGFPSTDPSGGNPYFSGGLSDKNLHTVLPGEGRPRPDFTPGSPAAAAWANHDQDSNTLDKGTALQRLLLGAVNSPDDVLSLQQQLIKAGILNPRSRSFIPGDIQPGDATYSAFSTLLDKSIQTGKPYGELLTDGAKRGVGAKNYEYYLRKFGPDGTGGGPQDYTNTSTDIPSALDARSLLTAAAEKLWGRKPSDAEISQFTTQLVSYAQSNPTVTSGVRPGTDGTGDATSTTSGGMNAGEASQLAEQFATSGTNAVNSQGHAINQYMQMFEDAIRGGAAKVGGE